MITVAELNTVAPDEVIHAITDSNDAIAEKIIEETAQTVKSYLHHRYDIEAIFSATGDDRHPDLLRIIKEIAIYRIYTRRTRDAINEAAMHRYEYAMRELKDIAKGVIHPHGLPLLTQQTASIFFKGGTPHDTQF